MKFPTLAPSLLIASSLGALAPSAWAQSAPEGVYLDAQAGTAFWSGPAAPSRPAGSDGGSGTLAFPFAGSVAVGRAGTSGWGAEAYVLGGQSTFDALSHAGAAAVFEQVGPNWTVSYKLGLGQTRVEEATPWQTPSTLVERKTDVLLGLGVSRPLSGPWAWSSQVRYLPRTHAITLTTGLRWNL